MFTAVASTSIAIIAGGKSASIPVKCDEILGLLELVLAIGIKTSPWGTWMSSFIPPPPEADIHLCA